MIFFRMVSYCLLLLLSSCMVGPKYKRPAAQLPEKYTQSSDPNTRADLAMWWTFFEDPYLTRLVEKAIKNNYDLRIATEKIIEARAFYRIQEANVCPEVDFNGHINRSGYSKNSAQGAALARKTLSYFQAGFDAMWEVDFFGKLRREMRAAYDEYEAQIESMRDVYIILLGDITKAYIDCRTFQKKIDLLTRQINVDTRIFSLTHDRFHSGVDSQLSDLSQQAALCESKNQLIFLQTALTQSINKIAILLGEHPEEFSLSDGEHRVPQSKKSLEVGLPSDLLRRRPDIRQAERLLAAATEHVGQALAQWFPTFTLLGSVGLESNNSSKWFASKSFTWSIGPSVTWPIITFGRIKFLVEEKQSVQRQALLRYGKSIVNALSDVENSLIAYFNGKNQVAIVQEKRVATLKQRDLMNELFRSGLVYEIDFLNAEKNCLRVEIELTDSEQALSSSLVSVYKSLGGGW